MCQYTMNCSLGNEKSLRVNWDRQVQYNETLRYVGIQRQVTKFIYISSTWMSMGMKLYQGIRNNGVDKAHRNHVTEFHVPPPPSHLFH